MNSNGGIMKQVLFSIAIIVALPLAVRATDGTWNVDAAGNWSTAGSWVGSVIPGSTTVSNSTDTAFFSKLLTAARTVTVDTSRNIKNITFDGGNSDTNGYTLSGGSFVLTSGGSIQATGSAGAHTDTISSPLTIVGNNATYTIANDSSLATRRLSISGDVTGQSTAGNTTTLVLGGNSPGTNGFSGALNAGAFGGTLALVKEGSGTWTITSPGGAERTDETTAFTINGGTLRVPTENQVRNALGAAPTITLANVAGAQLDFGASNHNKIIGFGSLSGGGTNGGDIVNAGYANSGIYIGFDNTSTTFGGRFIAGQAGGGIIKVGTGTLTLTGSGNDAGGTTTLRGGSLSLDFSLAATNADILASTRAMQFEGGRLLLTGSSGAANSQSFASTTVAAGGSGIALSGNGAASLLASLGAITRNAGGVLDVTLPAGTQATTNGVRTTTTTAMNGVLATANSSGIAYATVGGTDWAALSSGNIIAFSSYSNGVGSYTTANNVNVANGDSVSGVTVNTLRFTGDHTLTLSSVNTVGAGGVLVTTGATTGATISGGTLRSGGGKELVLINNGAQFTIGSTIADSSSGASALTLSGTGGFRLNGNNTYTGATYIHSGTVTLGSATALGASGSSAVWIGDSPTAVLDLNGYDITIGSLAGAGGSISAIGNAFGTPGGRVLIGAKSLTVGANNTSTTYGGRISGSGTFTKVGTGTNTISGAGALAGFSGSVVVEAGTLTVGSVADTQAGTEQLGTATIYLGKIGGGTANARLDLTGATSRPIVLVAGNSGTMTIGQTPNSRTASNTRFAGTITGTGDLVVLRESQSASLTISGLINHTGNLTLRKSISSSSGFSVSGGIGSNVLNVTLDNVLHNAAAGISIPSTVASTGTLTNIGAYGTTISGNITSASRLVQNGAGTLTISGTNTFTGDTFIQTGTLTLGNNLALQNSGLDTAGAGVMDATSRTTPTFGGLIGSKDLTNVITTGYGAITTLTLNPQAGKSYTYSGAITNGAANMALTKSGPGTQVLNGNNSYSGATTVSNGALRLASANALPGGIGVSGGSSLVKFAGGVLELTAAVGDFTRRLGTGVTNAQFTGGGGFSAYGANRFVNLGGATTQVTWAVGNFVPTGSSLLFGSSTADARIEFQNPIDLGAGTRTIQVDDNPATANDYALLSGVVTNGALVKTGDGMLVLGASTNRLSGLTVSNGTLVVSGVTTSSALTVVSNATALINGSYADPVTVQQGGTIGGTGTLLSSLTLNAGAKLRVTIQSAGGATDALTVSNSLNVAGVTLEIVNTNLLTVGTAYTVLNGAHTGTFVGSNLPADWMIDYQPTAIKVKTSRLLGMLIKVQ